MTISEVTFCLILFLYDVEKKVFFSKIKRSSLVIHVHRFILWLFTDLCVDIPFCLVIKLPELQVITTPFFEKQNSLQILVSTESMTQVIFLRGC